MNQAIAWFAKNRVTANLLMIFIIIAGFIAVRKVKIEVFPEFSSDTISISVAYRGAAPEEVEEGVCVRIEEAIQGLEGVKKINSTASEGSGSVSIEVQTGYDARKLLDDVKSRVDAISTFPQETEKPVIQELLLRRQVISVAVSGQTDEKSLKTLAEQIRDEIVDIPEISQVEIASTRPYEISIEVSEEALTRFGLTFDEVARAVRLSSLDLPGGNIKTSAGDLSLRTKGQAYKGSEYANLIIRSLHDGTRLKLGDVATVNDGFAETDQAARFNGEPVALIQVFRVGDENALTIANAVKEYVEKAKLKVPEGINLTTWQDDSLILKGRLNLLVNNGRNGLILVFIALAIFLRMRLAWWVTVGMVVSFFGAFWMMPINDVSINMISLFAFVLVLGIVVDDAIVIGENIYTKLEEGINPLQAAIKGAQEVATPVIFAVLTTIAAFSPLLYVGGFMGKIMYVIPVIVIATLVFSLIESLFILPAHLSHVYINGKKKSSSKIGNLWKKFQDTFERKLKNFINTYYMNALRYALRNRYLTLSIAISFLIITMSVLAGGWLKFEFMPETEADNVMALLTMPQGTPVEITSQAISRIEESARLLQEEYTRDGQGPVQHVLASIGDQPSNNRGPNPHGGSGMESAANIGEVNLQLYAPEIRNVSSKELAARWRELTGVIPDAEELAFSSSLMSAGEAINIQFSGTNYEELQLAAEELKIRIADYNGVFDIADSYREGKQEIKLKIKPEAESLGLTLTNIARQVRQAFYGEEAQRIQRGRDDVRVMVRYPEAQRTSVGDLENMRIRVPGGGEMPFSLAAEIERGMGFSSISRTDRKRTINITADVDDTKANANEIVGDITNNLLPELLAKYPGVSYTLQGQQYEMQESLAGLAEGFVFALLLIYVLLAIPFRSYAQPLIVMSAIPFGLIGAVVGHFVIGMNLTMISGFGIVALAGIVVNDSLVFVDFINRKRAEGKPLEDAITAAGISRFRPIVLTSLTTFAGLTPMLLETSMQARFLIPMAISLAFGVLFATLITLVLIPANYYILEDIKAWGRRQAGKEVAVAAE